MTLREYQSERNYRVQERLGILGIKGEPSKRVLEQVERDVEKELNEIERVEEREWESK